MDVLKPGKTIVTAERDDINTDGADHDEVPAQPESSESSKEEENKGTEWTLRMVIVRVVPVAFVLGGALVWYQIVSGGESKDVADTIVKVIGGVVLVVGLFMSYRRVLAMQKTADNQVTIAQAQLKNTDVQLKTIELQTRGQQAERFTKAMEQLGEKDKLAIRLGGIYSLESLHEDSDSSRKQAIVETLSAFVREESPAAPNVGTSDANLSESDSDECHTETSDTHKLPPTDILAAVRVLGRLKDKAIAPDLHLTNLVGANLVEANLEGANLEGAILYSAKLGGTNLVGANLYRAKLYRAKLHSADLAEANLYRANLYRAKLYRANLYRAKLEGAILAKAKLYRANLEGAKLEGANLDGANLYKANLVGAILVEANLVEAKLYRANLKGTDLEGADLVGANLEGANLQGADLVEANLEGAKLYRADLVGADLYRANLVGADLYRAKLEGANLYRANLEGADLEGADLVGADLVGADLEGAILVEANLVGAKLRGHNLDDLKQRGAILDKEKVSPPKKPYESESEGTLQDEINATT